MDVTPPKGRLAPSPSGRMHLGNVFAALLAYLSVKSKGGRLVLRIEDLDEARCQREYAERLMDDLHWLGLDWDEEPVWQSQRKEFYGETLRKLEGKGLLYPCYCTRKDRQGTAPTEASAPHGEVAVYDGRCRERPDVGQLAGCRPPALRLALPDETLTFTDGHMGTHCANLRRECGDPILRRSDGLYAYHLAATADDGAMNITEIVRGGDLITATPVQIWLMGALDYATPTYYHAPLLIAPDGRKLSKRDGDLDMGNLRARFTPPELLGRLAVLMGLASTQKQVKIDHLLSIFDWKGIPREDVSIAKSIGV